MIVLEWCGGFLKLVYDCKVDKVYVIFHHTWKRVVLVRTGGEMKVLVGFECDTFETSVGAKSASRDCAKFVGGGVECWIKQEGVILITRERNGNDSDAFEMTLT